MAFEGDPSTSSRPATRPWKAIAASVAALAVGAGGGSFVTWELQPVETVTIERAPTPQEVGQVCGPQVAAVAQDLDEAKTRVSDLESQVRDRQARVEQLERDMKKRAAKGAELVKALDEAKHELAQAKADLAVAVAERDRLYVALDQTQKELEAQKQETFAAKQDAVQSRWTAFVDDAQLQVCEKGNRKKLGHCRETVRDRLDADVAAGFTHCLRAGQEAPSLHEADKGAELPQFADYLDEDSRVTKGWYVQLCDPTLPESADLAQVAVQTPEPVPPVAQATEE